MRINVVLFIIVNFKCSLTLNVMSVEKFSCKPCQKKFRWKQHLKSSLCFWRLQDGDNDNNMFP